MTTAALASGNNTLLFFSTCTEAIAHVLFKHAPHLLLIIPDLVSNS